MALIWKRAIFDLLFTFLVTREKTQKVLQQIPHLHTRILLTLLTFLPDQFCKNYEFIMYGFSLVWLLACLVLVLFCAILEQSINNRKWWANFRLEYLLLIFIYTNAKYIVICKPHTLNDGIGEDSIHYRKHKKALLLSSNHFFTRVFYRLKNYNLVTSLSCLEALLFDVTSYTLNGSQLAKMKKSIPDMSLPYNL